MVELVRWIYNKYVFSVGRFRAVFYSFFCEHIGKNTHFLSGVRILCPAKVRIGDDTSVNIYTSLDGNGGLTIGNHVMIGSFSHVLTANHGFSNRLKPMIEQPIETKPVVIEDDVWLGSCSIILPGVTLGKGCIVAAGAVVTKSVEPYHIVGGVPAKTISVRP